MIVIPQHSNKQKGLYFPLCGKQLEFRFSFDESFDYVGKNQSDLHKIGGIGIFSIPHSFKVGKNKKWWELHKWFSLRIGARRNYAKNCIELTDYSYFQGVGERNTDDNQILDAQKGEIVYGKVSIEKNGMRLVLVNETSLKNINVFIKMDLPTFYLPLRLRAYMENVHRTKDVIIHTHK